MAFTGPQIQVSTTLPSFEYLPFPVPQSSEELYPFYRPLVPDDLEAYTSFLKEDLVTHGLCNPKFDLRGEDEGYGIEIVAEGGVYIPDKGWPSIYWTSRKDEEEDVNIDIVTCIHDFWWSLPRQNVELIVDPNTILKNSQGVPQPNEELHAYDVDESFIPGNAFAFYRPGHFISFKRIPLLTTVPCLDDASTQPIPSTDRLDYRPLTEGDVEAWYRIRKEKLAMTTLGAENEDHCLNCSRRKLLKELPCRYHQFPLHIGIFLKNGKRKGKMIGYLWVTLSLMEDMPSLAFIFRQKYWGKRYGTEAVRNFIQYWRSLPRKEVYHLMDPYPLDFPQENSRVPEQLHATTDNRNKRGEGVLRQSGFRILDNKDMENNNWRLLI